MKMNKEKLTKGCEFAEAISYSTLKNFFYPSNKRYCSYIDSKYIERYTDWFDDTYHVKDYTPESLTIGIFTGSCIRQAVNLATIVEACNYPEILAIPVITNVASAIYEYYRKRHTKT